MNRSFSPSRFRPEGEKTPGPDIEESLRRAFAYGRGGEAAVLHAAGPRVRQVAAAVERLREAAKGVGG